MSKRTGRCDEKRPRRAVAPKPHTPHSHAHTARSPHRAGSAQKRSRQRRQLQEEPTTWGTTMPQTISAPSVYAKLVETGYERHIPYLSRKFEDDSAKSDWILARLPSNLTTAGWSLKERLETAGTYNDCHNVMVEATKLVS